MEIVPALDEVEDRHASLGVGAKRLLVEQLALQHSEEAWIFPGIVDTSEARIEAAGGVP